MITALSSGGGGYQLSCKTRAVLATTAAAAQCAPSQARTGESCAGCWPPVTRQSRGLTLYGHWTLHPPHYTQADIYHASSVFMNINVQLLNKASYFKLSTYYLSCYLHISTHGRWSVRPGWAGQGELTGALWPVVAPLPYIEARSQRAVQIFNIDSNV